MKKLIGVSLVLSSVLFAKDFVVCNNGCPYNSIQAAIDDLNNENDEYNITIKPGIYKGPIKITKSVNLIGEDPKRTIITGDNQNYVLSILINNGNYDKITIKNLSIRNGNARNGSALFIKSENKDKILVKNVIFSNNKVEEYGGAIYTEGGFLTFEDCKFINNKADNKGGAIYDYSTSLIIKNCEFDNNRANEKGGAIYNSSYSYLRVENSEFDNNIASEGGAIYSYSEVNIVKSNFDSNIATQEGGAIYFDSYSKKLIIIDSWIINNKSNNSVGAISASGNLYIQNSIIANNTAKKDINAIYVYGNVDVESSDFVNNRTKNNKLGFYIKNSSDKAIIQNSVFYNNSFVIGKDGNEKTYNSVVMIGNVFDKNGVSVGSNIDLNTNKFIEGNVSLFVDPSNFDFSLPTNSILIDASVNDSYLDTDITGTIRPQGENGDIGACEYPSICKFKETSSVANNQSSNENNISYDQTFVAKNVVIDVEKGWNLKSIPYYAPIKIADIIKGDENKIRTIWFWDAKNKKWEVYSPNPAIQEILKDYQTLDILDTTDTIDVGAGFWVDAIEPFEFNVPVFIQK